MQKGIMTWADDRERQEKGAIGECCQRLFRAWRSAVQIGWLNCYAKYIIKGKSVASSGNE